MPSVRRVLGSSRCGSLHSNPTILRYDYDILIADFGQDLARLQAQLLLEFRLYAAKARFSVDIARDCPYATPNQHCQKAGYQAILPY